MYRAVGTIIAVTPRLTQSRKSFSKNLTMLMTGNQTSELDESGNNTSMNYMLVVFCIVLVCFVALNRNLSDKLRQKQLQTEHAANPK